MPLIDGDGRAGGLECAACRCRHPRVRSVRAAARDVVRDGAARRHRDVRVCGVPDGDDVRGDIDRAEAAAHRAHRQGRDHRQDARLRAVVVGRPGRRTIFCDIDLRAMFETLRQRLGWAAQRIDMPAGSYEVLLEPSCAADLAICAYWFMTRRDADEGRSPYSKPGGGTRIGERLFGDVTIYSDPDEPGIEADAVPLRRRFGRARRRCSTTGCDSSRTEWVRDGVLQHLITPRYWAAKMARLAPCRTSTIWSSPAAARR